MSNDEMSTAKPEAEELIEKKTGEVELRAQADTVFEEFAGGPFASTASERQWFRLAKLLAGSMFVPRFYQGKPEDVLVALDLARQLGEPPLAVLQGSYVVHGTPGWRSDFLLSRLMRVGRVVGPPEYLVKTLDPPTVTVKDYPVNRQKGGAARETFELPNLEVRVLTRLPNGSTRTSSPVTTSMAIGEGWIANPKYQSMTEHMLRFRALGFHVREFHPEVMAGMPLADEVIDVMSAQVARDALAPAPAEVPPALAEQAKANGGGVAEKLVTAARAERAAEEASAALSEIEAVSKEAVLVNDHARAAWTEAARVAQEMSDQGTEIEAVSKTEELQSDKTRVTSRALAAFWRRLQGRGFDEDQERHREQIIAAMEKEAGGDKMAIEDLAELTMGQLRRVLATLEFEGPQRAKGDNDEPTGDELPFDDVPRGKGEGRS